MRRKLLQLVAVIFAFFVFEACQKHELRGNFSSFDQNGKSCKIYNITSDSLFVFDLFKQELDSFKIEEMDKNKISILEGDKNKPINYYWHGDTLELQFPESSSFSGLNETLTGFTTDMVEITSFGHLWSGIEKQPREDLQNHWLDFREDRFLRMFAKFKGIDNKVSRLPDSEYSILNIGEVTLLILSDGTCYIIKQLNSEALILLYVDCEKRVLTEYRYNIDMSDDSWITNKTWHRTMGENIYDLPEKMRFYSNGGVLFGRENGKANMKDHYVLGPENSFIFSKKYEPIKILKLTPDTLLIEKFNTITFNERALYVPENP